MVITKLVLDPVKVKVKNPMGEPVIGAQVRATYAHSSLSSSANSAEDGVATVPLLYCDNEPMRIEAVAAGYQAETVGEFIPNKEAFILPMTLQELKSEWEQVTIPLTLSNNSGKADLPPSGRIQIDRTNFHIIMSGEVSVNGTVRTWHSFKVGDEYNIVTNDGTELTLRFLELVPGFSVTLEISPPKPHQCGG